MSLVFLSYIEEYFLTQINKREGEVADICRKNRPLMQRLIVSLILFVNLGALSAQRESELSVPTEKKFNNAIQLRGGCNLGYFKDINFSPLNYQLSGTALGLAFAHQSKSDKALLLAQVEYNSNTVKHEISEAYTADYTIFNLELIYLRKLNCSKAKLYVGGQYKSNINYLDYDDQSAFSFLIAHSLGISGRGEININQRSSIGIGMSIPVISLIGRPPYNGLDKEIEEKKDDLLDLATDGTIESYNRYKALDFVVQFKYALSQRFNLALNYGAYYQKVTTENRLTQFSNQITLGFITKL